MKHSAQALTVIAGATLALVAGLLVVVFGGDMGTFLYSVAVAVIGTFALLVFVVAVKGRQLRVMAVAFIAVTAVVVVKERPIRRHLDWLIWSDRYKSEALADSTLTNSELKHVEWDGDGWGSAMTGDWMSYVVFDPSDSLSAATKSDIRARYKGIPCTVRSVRRLEKQWYSVVLDMNQFWNKMHPAC